MIVMVARGGDPGAPPWADVSSPELHHHPTQLVPGLQVEAVLRGKREHHLHAFFVDQRSIATLTLHAPEHLALWLRDPRFGALAGPSMLVQQVLERGAYWAHVGTLGSARTSSGPYRLRLHCDAL